MNDGQHNIIIAGLGGQGVLTLTYTIANAARIYGEFPAVGEIRKSTQRGGEVVCSIRWSGDKSHLDAQVCFRSASLIFVLHPDVLVSAVEKYANENTIICLADTQTNLDLYKARIEGKTGKIIVFDGMKKRHMDRHSQGLNVLLLANAVAHDVFHFGALMIRAALHEIFDAEKFALNCALFDEEISHYKQDDRVNSHLTSHNCKRK